MKGRKRMEGDDLLGLVILVHWPVSRVATGPMGTRLTPWRQWPVARPPPADWENTPDPVVPSRPTQLLRRNWTRVVVLLSLHGDLAE